MAINAQTAQPDPWRARLAVAFSRPVLRKAIIAAGLVGSLHILINQGDLLFSGQITGRVLLKCLITPIIPFCVTMLGAVLNSGNAATRPEDLRPGWAAVRRSIIIAVVVGGTILTINQIDLIIAGHLTPLMWLKIGLTPCIPFCVSLYGAYIAYHNALAAQPPGA